MLEWIYTEIGPGAMRIEWFLFLFFIFCGWWCCGGGVLVVYVCVLAWFWIQTVGTGTADVDIWKGGHDDIVLLGGFSLDQR